jgi:hypothetical protein
MIEPLRIQATIDCPDVTLDKEMNRFEFNGKALPENPKEFFNPIVAWIKDYVKEPNKETAVAFKMEYINSASQKRIHDIILLCKEIHEKGVPIYIDWYYHAEDEGMKEEGQTLSELVNIPFRFFIY